MKIIGISGRVRSGKDTLADMLIEDGFFGVSFGDIVRDFARKRHADKPDPISIENMTDTANWLREEHGPDVILQEALSQYKQALKSKVYKGLVLYSVRAPAEVDWILAQKGHLVWVDATDQVRYERAMNSLREGDPQIDFKEYKRQEDLQWKPQPGIPDEVQMNLSYVKDHATEVLENNGNDISVFELDAKNLINTIL